MFAGLKNAAMWGLVLGIIAFFVSIISTFAIIGLHNSPDFAYALGASGAQGLIFGGIILVGAGVWWNRESSSNWAVGAILLFSLFWSGRLDIITQLLVNPADLLALAIHPFYPYWLIGYAAVAIIISFFEWRKSPY